LTIRIGSLFTGYGGLDMAARALFPDATTAWVCDIKPAAVALLEHRFPGAPNLGDVTAAFPVMPDNLFPADPDDYPPVTAEVEPVDVLTFGWPCQPHSSAGKRLGEAGPPCTAARSHPRRAHSAATSAARRERRPRHLQR
jgi:DNA (cytosine-5)-methyltransferase 1